MADRDAAAEGQRNYMAAGVDAEEEGEAEAAALTGWGEAAVLLRRALDRSCNIQTPCLTGSNGGLYYGCGCGKTVNSGSRLPSWAQLATNRSGGRGRGLPDRVILADLWCLVVERLGNQQLRRGEDETYLCQRPSRPA